MSTQQQSGKTQQDGGTGGYAVDFENLGAEVMNLKNELEVQRAINAGTQATQAAVEAGQASTNMAAHAGQAATMAAGGAALVAGMIIGLLIGIISRPSHIHRT